MSAFWDKLKRSKEEAEEKAPVSSGAKSEKEQEKETQEKEEVKKDSKSAKEKEQPEKPQEKKEVEEKPKKDESKSAKSDKKGKEKKKNKKKREFPKEQAVLIARTIIKPKVSEAAMNQQTMAKYVFYVRQNASKNEVAKAVQAMYGKEVRKVNIINYSPQKRTFRGYKGMVKGYKKAIVSLEKGQTIDVFNE